ncbi:MAG TPA: LamG domain-containing protein [Kiritimatiellia bacterium]|nr:LamG domain-containing protein [Kiritimatiellia bacterium]
MRQMSQTDYTLETWFRTSAQTRGTLMGNHSDAAPKGVINMELHGTNNVRLYQCNADGAVTDMNLLVTNLNTRNYQWHHLAGVRRDSTMVLYLDGQEVGSTNTALGSYTLAGDYMYLGRDERTTVAFNGELGTARVWMRALSTNELAGIVALGVPGGSAVSNDSLLAEYDLHAPFNAYKPGLGFPGYQIAQAPPKFKQIPMTNFTCEAVFRTTAPNIGTTILMGNWSNNMYSAVNLQLEDNNTVRLYMRNTAGTVASLAKVPANVNTRDGNWHRLAAVRGNNTIALYLDGQLVGSQAETLGAYPLQGPYYYLGRDGRDPWFNRFVGDIAAARIWTRALSAGELAGLAASNAVPADGLLAQYAPMLTNSLVTAGFPNSRFLRSFTTRTNSATLVFADLPRHDKIGLGMLLAQLDQLEPVSGGDRFVLRVDGTEVLRVGLGPNQGTELQVSTLSVLGVPTDVGVIKNTLTCGDDLFFCGTAWNDYRDHVYDLALLEPLQRIPHTADTLVVELLGIQDTVGDNEGYGIDRFELTVYPRRGTLIAVK